MAKADLDPRFARQSLFDSLSLVNGNKNDAASLAVLAHKASVLIFRLARECGLRFEDGKIFINGTCGSADEICEWADIGVNVGENASDAIKREWENLEDEIASLRSERDSAYRKGWEDCREAIVKAINGKYNETVDDIGQMKSVVENQTRSLRVNRSKLAALLEHEEALNRAANVAANVELSAPGGDKLRKDVVADHVKGKNPA
jgi:hypothetical protein